MEIEEVLDKRLNAIENSPNDIECFKHIHGYINYLLTTPELKSILDTEEKDFCEKVQFVKDGYKAEQANFYQAYFVASYMRIYLPIEHYQNSPEPDSEQDPVALLLLYGFKHPRTRSWVNRYPVFSMKRERLKELKSYWLWFDGQRQEYVDEIKNLHLEIITALSKQTAVKPVLNKQPPAFTLDIGTGDFHYGLVTDSLNIKTQPFRVLKKLYLAEGKTVPYLDLIQCLKPSIKEVTKSDKQTLGTVIRNLKKTLGITKGSNKDIFYNEPLHGYSLKCKD